MPEAIISPTAQYIEKIITFLPNVIAAFVILVGGWVIASALGKALANFLKKAKLDEALERFGWREVLEKADVKFSISEFLGWLLKWILAIAVISLTVEVLGFEQFAILLNRFLAWLPNLIAALFIVIVAFIIADVLDKIVRAFAKKAQLRFSETLGVFTRWLIYVFAVLIALMQVGLARDLLVILFSGIVATLSLALGLAFGLGGKEIAAEILRELKRKLEEK